jgi:DNA-binding NarL/FixJ family response regulator
MTARRCPNCGFLVEEKPGEISHAAGELLSKLSEAQIRVLVYLLQGLTEPQIAQKIHRSRHTVHDHTKAIYSAMGVKRRVQLVLLFQGTDPNSLLARGERPRA